MNRYVFLIFFIMAFTRVHSGGWPQGKGEAFVKVNQYAIFAPWYFFGSGEIDVIPRSNYFSSSLYGEYGITSKLTAVVYFPFFVRNTVATAGSINSLGDTDVALKYNIFAAGGWTSMAGVTLGIPLGRRAGGVSGLVQTGDGEYNQMLSFELSRSLGNKGNGYMTLLTAYNHRTNGFSDEFRYGWEYGQKIKKIWIILRVYGVNSFKNKPDIFPYAYSIHNNYMEYLAISPEIVYEINEKVGLTGGAGFAAYGKRLLASPSWSLGAYMKF